MELVEAVVPDVMDCGESAGTLPFDERCCRKGGCVTGGREAEEVEAERPFGGVMSWIDRRVSFSGEGAFV